MFLVKVAQQFIVIQRCRKQYKSSLFRHFLVTQLFVFQKMNF